MNKAFELRDVIHHVGTFTGHKHLSEVNRSCYDVYARVPIRVNSELSVDKTVDMFHKRNVKILACHKATTRIDFAKLFLSFPRIYGLGFVTTININNVLRCFNLDNIKHLNIIIGCVHPDLTIINYTRNANAVELTSTYRCHMTQSPNMFSNIESMMFNNVTFNHGLDYYFPNLKNIVVCDVHNSYITFGGNYENVKTFSPNGTFNYTFTTKNMEIYCDDMNFQCVNLNPTITHLNNIENLKLLSHSDNILISDEKCQELIEKLDELNNKYLKPFVEETENIGLCKYWNALRYCHFNGTTRDILSRQIGKHERIYRENINDINNNVNQIKIIPADMLKTLTISSRFPYLFKSPVLEHITLVFDAEPYNQKVVDRYMQHYGRIDKIVILKK